MSSSEAEITGSLLLLKTLASNPAWYLKRTLNNLVPVFWQQFAWLFLSVLQGIRFSCLETVSTNSNNPDHWSDRFQRDLMSKAEHSEPITSR
jgi:hypothetical protein